MKTINDSCQVYIVFSKTNTGIGKIIRTLTHNKYNHVSISLDKELSTMYSFGRYHINSPLVGGFVIEQPARYLWSGKEVGIKLCEYTLDPITYAQLQRRLLIFINDRNTKIYNSFSAIFSLFHKRLVIEDAYTCLEFVVSLLDIEGIYNIKELEDMLNESIVYQGSFRSYIRDVLPQEDEYFKKEKTVDILLGTLSHFKKLFIRFIT